MAILTISRQLGSGGREVGQAVSSLLHYDYVDKEKFLSTLKGVDDTWEQWGKDLDEFRPSFLEKYTWPFTAYGALVRSILLNYALADNVVLMGRGGNYLLKDIPHAYRIRLVAPVEERIKKIALRESIDFKSARRLTKTTDRARAGFIHSLFGKPWDDPAEFDEVFDISERPIEQIITHVTQTLAARDRLKSAQVARMMKMRATAAEVKAGLLMNPKIFAPTLDVEIDGRQLVVTGIVRGPKHFRLVENEARKLAGHLSLKCEMQHRG